MGEYFRSREVLLGMIKLFYCPHSFRGSLEASGIRLGFGSMQMPGGRRKSGKVLLRINFVFA